MVKLVEIPLDLNAVKHAIVGHVIQSDYRRVPKSFFGDIAMTISTPWPPMTRVGGELVNSEGKLGISWQAVERMLHAQYGLTIHRLCARMGLTGATMKIKGKVENIIDDLNLSLVSNEEIPWTEPKPVIDDIQEPAQASEDAKSLRQKFAAIDLTKLTKFLIAFAREHGPDTRQLLQDENTVLGAYTVKYINAQFAGGNVINWPSFASPEDDIRSVAEFFALSGHLPQQPRQQKARKPSLKLEELAL
jgi:hypothetical protein